MAFKSSTLLILGMKFSMLHNLRCKNGNLTNIAHNVLGVTFYPNNKSLCRRRDSLRRD